VTPPFDWRSLVFWPAVPVLAAQGLWLRRTAWRAPEAAGERHGEAGDAAGEPLRLLALGDSIIVGVGIDRLENALPGQFALALARSSGRRVSWQALGRNGADAGETCRRLEENLHRLRDCHVLLLSTGVNDVTGLRARRRVATDLDRLLRLVAQHAPDCRVLLAAAPPLDAFPLLPAPLRQLLGLRARQIDTVMAWVAARHGHALHVPLPFHPDADGFADDGFHPNAASCAQWAEWLASQHEALGPLHAPGSPPASAAPDQR